MEKETVLANSGGGETTLTQPLLKSKHPKIKRPSYSIYALACAFTASVASLLLGYNIAVMSGAQIFIKEDLHMTDTEIEILTGIVNLYSLAGSLTAGWTSDCIGRRRTLTLTAVIYFLGPLIICLSNNYFWLMVGRFVTGIGVGYTVIVPIYVTEIAPVAMRGFLSSVMDLSVTTGLLLAYISNFLLADLSVHLSWRMMFALGIVPAALLSFSTLALPESPRWLVMKGKLAKAQEVLARLAGSLEDGINQLEEIKEAAGIPKGDTADVLEIPKQSRGTSLWKELIAKPTPLWRIVMTVLAMHFFQQGSGIDTVVIYSPRVFEKAGMKSNNDLLAATMAVGLVKTVSIPVAMVLSDRVGRRSLLVSSTAGMAASLAMLGFGLQTVDGFGANQTWIIAVCIVAVFAFVSFFSIGMGPLAMAYSTEIMPLKLRAQGAALGMAMNRTVCAIVTMTFISLYETITIAGSFYFYAGISGIACAFVYFCLPETKGRSLEEIERLFDKEEKEAPKGNEKCVKVAV